jgi:putative MATE family efflux protein
MSQEILNEKETKKRSRIDLGKIFAGEIDLTTGNLFAKMSLFSLPIMLLSLLQLLYSSADEFVVANWGGGYTSMNAVGCNSALISLIIGFFVGISVGANVVVAKEKGRKDPASAHRAIESSMALSVVFGLIVAVAGYFSARGLLELMQTPVEFLDKATDYLQWYFIGMPFAMIFNFGSAILRAEGDSKRPLYALLFCGTLNVGLNFLFVMVFGLDVKGVAMTTVISEFLEAILVVIFLMNGKNHFAYFSFKDIAIYPQETAAILKNGIPAGFQSLAFSISNVFIQWGVNSYSDARVTNDVAVAGNTASTVLEGYISIVMDAFSTAVIAIVAQNYGAGNKKYIRKTLWMSIAYITGLGLLLGLLATIFRYQLCGIFISQASFTDATGFFDEAKYEAAMELATTRLMIISLTYFLDGVMNAASAFCRGLEHAKTPTFVTLVAVTVFRIAFILLLWMPNDFFHTLPWLWSIWPISWVFAIIAYFCFIPKYIRQAEAEIDARPKSGSPVPQTGFLAPESSKLDPK